MSKHIKKDSNEINPICHYKSSNDRFSYKLRY